MPRTSSARSVGRGSSAWRRAKASRRWVSDAPRWAPCVAPSIRRSMPGSDGKRLRRSSRLPSTAVSRLLKSCATPPVSWPIDSSFCMWRSCSSVRARSAICRHQLVMGMLKLGGALIDPSLELVVDLLQAQFTLAQILEQRSRFVLAATALDRGARHAQQRRRMERTFDERYVAQCLQPARGDGIALRAAAVIGHQHERQVGPGGLTGQPQRKRLEVGDPDRLLGHQDEGHVVVEDLDEPRKIAAGEAGDVRPAR